MAIILANPMGTTKINFYLCSVLLLFSMLFDTLDGYLARKLNAQSDLGKELDSLADLVSFGVAPAYLYFLLAPNTSLWFMIPAVLIAVASGLRLAKFNILPSYDYFQGLPTPANAFFYIGIFLAVHYQNDLIVNAMKSPIIYFIIPIIFGLLMLSTLKMFSLKGLEKPFIKNRYQIILFASFIVLLLFDNKLAIPLTVIMFIFLSILQSTRRKL